MARCFQIFVFQVWTFVCALLEDLTGRHINIEVIDVFSDGTSIQFIQKYLFSNLSKWQSAYGVTTDWHFFATSHGKGIIDGIGGTVKRSVWRAVRNGSARASTPYQFYEVAERPPCLWPRFQQQDFKVAVFLDPESKSSESDNSNKSSEDESVDSYQGGGVHWRRILVREKVKEDIYCTSDRY